MLSSLSSERWKVLFKRANPPFKRKDVVEVIAMSVEDEMASDAAGCIDGLAVFKLRNGHFATIEALENYSFPGRSRGKCYLGSNLQDVLKNGLAREQRNQLFLFLDENEKREAGFLL